MNMEHFKPLSKYIDTLPDPETPYEKFMAWLSNLIDEVRVRRWERKNRH